MAPFDTSGRGGLENYTRGLHQALGGDDSGCRLPATDHALWQSRTNRLLPFMTRPSLRWVARRYAERLGRRQCKALVEGCDVVHFVGTGWHLLGFPLQKAAAGRGVPITCWPAVHPGSWGDAPLDIDLYRRMDAVFVQSDYERDYLEGLGVPGEKLVRCGCAAPSETPGDGARFRQQHGLDDRRLVLFIGRKDRNKGYHAIREAIGRLNAGGEPVTLVSIGRAVEPPYPPLPPEIDLDLGTADDAVKHDALAACDVFALPSAAESFGIVYVEAWAYSKPVLGGTAPASIELINRHKGGLVSDGTPDGIASTLLRLFHRPDFAQACGESGRSAALSEYTISSVVQTHQATWERLQK